MNAHSRLLLSDVSSVQGQAGYATTANPAGRAAESRPAGGGRGPARPGIDYALTANDVRILRQALRAYRQVHKSESDERQSRELDDLLYRGFETVIRDVQP